MTAAVQEIVHQQWVYRALLLRMTMRDLLLRDKQTFMRVGWAIFMPWLNLAIFSVVFTRVATIDVGTLSPVPGRTRSVRLVTRQEERT